MANKILSDQRILVVEDEAMIAMLIEDMLGDLGCIAVGLAYNAKQALQLIEAERFDAAVLDLNLDGLRTTPVAESLASKGIPFCFATGYGRGGLPEEFGKHIVLTKPFNQCELEGALKRLIC